MGDHQHGFAARHLLFEDLQHALGGFTVQVAGGFVRYQDGRVIGQGAGYRGGLLLPAGHRRRVFMLHALQPDHFEQLHGALFALGGVVHIAKIHWQHHVFEQGQHGQELEELEDNTHVLAPPDRHAPLVHAVQHGLPDPHPPRGRMINAGHHIEQGRFAAARAPNDADELPLIEDCVQALQDHKYTRCILEGLDQVLDDNQFPRHNGCSFFFKRSSHR